MELEYEIRYICSNIQDESSPFQRCKDEFPEIFLDSIEDFEDKLCRGSLTNEDIVKITEGVKSCIGEDYLDNEEFLEYRISILNPSGNLYLSNLSIPYVNRIFTLALYGKYFIYETWKFGPGYGEHDQLEMYEQEN